MAEDKAAKKKIYEFNVESVVRQQNRVLVEADSEEEALDVVRGGEWNFLYRNYVDDGEDAEYPDPAVDPDSIFYLGLEPKEYGFELKPPKLIGKCKYE